MIPLLAAACPDIVPLPDLPLAGLTRSLPEDRRYTEVTCAPHARHGGHPVSEVRRCRREDDRWACQSVATALRLQFPNSTVQLAWRAGDVTPAAALSVANLLARDYAQTFNGQDLSLFLRGHCQLADGGPGPFRGARQLALRCDRGTLTLTNDCWQGRCRLYPAEITLVAVPATTGPQAKTNPR